MSIQRAAYSYDCIIASLTKINIRDSILPLWTVFHLLPGLHGPNFCLEINDVRNCIPEQRCFIHLRDSWNDSSKCIKPLVKLLAPLPLCFHVAQVKRFLLLVQSQTLWPVNLNPHRLLDLPVGAVFHRHRSQILDYYLTLVAHMHQKDNPALLPPLVDNSRIDFREPSSTTPDLSGINTSVSNRANLARWDLD
nr:hypothetical protein Iba_chr07cCG0480 [Ipomoea batatas]